MSYMNNVPSLTLKIKLVRLQFKS